MADISPQETLLHSCLEGMIAQRMSRIGRALGARLFLKVDKQPVFEMLAQIEKSGFAGYTNAARITSPDQVDLKQMRLGVTFLFDKIDRLSHGYMVRVQLAGNRLKYDVRTMPVILNNIHLQFRHGEDRASTPLSYGEDPYMRTLFLAMVMGEALESIPGVEKTGLFIPMNDGAVVGRIEKPRSSEFADRFFFFDAARNPKGRDHFFRKELPKRRPTRIAIVNTYIGPGQIDKKLDTTQRILHDAITAMLDEQHMTLMMETYFADYINHNIGPEVDDPEHIRQKKAASTAIKRTKRESGQTQAIGVPVLDPAGKQVLSSAQVFAKIDKLRRDLAELIKGDDWQRQSKISLAKPAKNVPL